MPLADSSRDLRNRPARAIFSKLRSRSRRYTRSTVQDTMDELVQKYSRLGHPSAKELVAAQGLTFPRDPRDLLGNFWPEEESIDDFLAEMRAWRGRATTDPAA
jgi:hypothetical protein